MPNNEQTHAKNLDNLRTAISIGESIGAVYKPSSNLIVLTVLGQFADTFTAKLQAVNDVLPADENAVDARMAAFKPVPKRVTQILNAAKAQGLSVESIATLRTTANALRGIRATKKVVDDPTTPEDESKKSISSSNRSYAGQLENLDLIVEQLKSLPAYAPNENEYTTGTLEGWVAGLNTLNQTAITTSGPVRTARNDRTAFCYSEIDGLIVRMKLIKAYAKTILPANDTRLIQLSKLSFKNFA